MTTDKNSSPDNLRDARLTKALQHMPDAHMQASSQARLAVLRAAHKAVGKAKTYAPSTASDASGSRWWHKILGRPQNRMPWNAAFATVLVASFVTVLWQGKEVPDAKPDSEKISEAAAIAPAPAPAPAPPAPSSSQAPAPFPASAPSGLSPSESPPAPAAPAARQLPAAPSTKDAAKAPSKESTALGNVKREDATAARIEKPVNERKIPDVSDRYNKAATDFVAKTYKSDPVTASTPTPPAMAETPAPAPSTTPATPPPAAAAVPMAAQRAPAPAAPAARTAAPLASDGNANITAESAASEQRSKSYTAPAGTEEIQINGQTRRARVAQVAQLLALLNSLPSLPTSPNLELSSDSTSPIYLRIRNVEYQIYPAQVGQALWSPGQTGSNTEDKKNGSSPLPIRRLSAEQYAQIKRSIAVLLQN